MESFQHTVTCSSQVDIVSVAAIEIYERVAKWENHGYQAYWISAAIFMLRK